MSDLKDRFEKPELYPDSDRLDKSKYTQLNQEAKSMLESVVDLDIDLEYLRDIMH